MSGNTPKKLPVRPWNLFPRSETAIRRECVKALNVIPGVVVWPNNVGGVRGEYKGKIRYVKFSFPGVSDIIGWKRKYLADSTHLWSYRPVWLALEVKRPDRVPLILAEFVTERFYTSGPKFPALSKQARLRAEQQAAFLRMVREAGGIAAVVTSVEEAIESVR